MYKVIMESNNIAKYFYFIKNIQTNKNYLAPKSKEIFPYYKNIKTYYSIDTDRNKYTNYNSCLRYFVNFEEYNNFSFSNNMEDPDERLVFEFETEEEAFYFKLKFC